MRLIHCTMRNNIGMICVATNYRGCGNSEGTDEFGGDDVDDVTKIVDLCEEFDYIDNSKINMLGISRGGMMTYEALKGNDKINKAVVISGLADAFMGYEERDDMKTLMKELIGSTPEEKTAAGSTHGFIFLLILAVVGLILQIVGFKSRLDF